MPQDVLNPARPTPTSLRRLRIRPSRLAAAMLAKRWGRW